MILQKPTKQFRILWVDDEESILSAVRRLLRSEPYVIDIAADPVGALEKIKNSTYDIIVSDYRMPQMTGTAFLEKVKSMQPSAVRLIVTGFLEAQLLSDAVNRAGVYRFISKPWTDSQLLIDLQQSARHSELVREQENLRKSVSKQRHDLEVLNAKLGQQAEEASLNLEISREEVKAKEARLKTLVQFVQRLSAIEGVDDLLLVLRSEFLKLPEVMDCIVEMQDTSASQLYYFHAGKFLSREIAKKRKIILDVAINSAQERKGLSTAAGRPIGWLLSFPVRSSTTSSQWILHLEFRRDSPVLHDVIKYLESLQHSLQMAFERISLTRETHLTPLQWSKTFNTLEDPVAIINSSYRVSISNKAFERSPASAKCFERFGAAKICDGCPIKEKNVSGKVRVQGRIFEVQSSQLPDLSDGLFINHYVDVTEAEELFGRAVQSQKMSAIGQLAGQITHHLTGPLTSIQALAKTTGQDETTPITLREDLSEIEKAAIRCQDIIKNLSTFSETEESSEVCHISVNQVVRKTLPLLKTVLLDRETEVNYSDSNLIVKGNFGLLQQTIYNLLHNAYQATQPGQKIRLSILEDRGFAKIEIQDSGCGISENLQDRVFEPFFTTKLEGVGTGLGLNFCQRVIKKFNGQISFKSEQGAGCVFSIYLPLQGKDLASKDVNC